MGIKAALPRYELYLYHAVLGLAMLWSASWILEVSAGEYIHMGVEFSGDAGDAVTTNIQRVLNCPCSNNVVHKRLKDLVHY